MLQNELRDPKNLVFDIHIAFYFNFVPPLVLRFSADNEIDTKTEFERLKYPTFDTLMSR